MTGSAVGFALGGAQLPRRLINPSCDLYAIHAASQLGVNPLKEY